MTRFSRFLTLGVALGALSACGPDGNALDWDLRGMTGGALDTSEAVRNATANRPSPDARGVISYPGYQVALARRGDTVASVASRLNINANELGGYNALKPDDLLRDGEVIACPAALNRPLSSAVPHRQALLSAARSRLPRSRSPRSPRARLTVLAAPAPRPRKRPPPRNPAATAYSAERLPIPLPAPMASASRRWPIGTVSARTLGCARASTC